MKDLITIYEQYALPVKKYVITLCNNEALADDITADTFVKVIKNIDSYNDEEKIFTWICEIAKNTFFDYIRKKENQNFDISDYELTLRSNDEIENQLLVNEDKLYLFRLLQKLDKDYKDVVYLRIFGDLSFKEIGDILEKTENWSRVMFYRGKNKLKGMIENEKNTM